MRESILNQILRTRMNILNFQSNGASGINLVSQLPSQSSQNELSAKLSWSLERTLLSTLNAKTERRKRCIGVEPWTCSSVYRNVMTFGTVQIPRMHGPVCHLIGYDEANSLNQSKFKSVRVSIDLYVNLDCTLMYQTNVTKIETPTARLEKQT